MRKAILISALLAATLLLPGCGGGPAPERPAGQAQTQPAKDNKRLPPVPPQTAYAVGEKIPPFALADLGGKQHAPEVFSASALTVLNFWSTT